MWINDSSCVFARWRHSAMKFLNKKLMLCSAYNIAEVHQFPRNSVMEFSEYLQWHRVAPFCATLSMIKTRSCRDWDTRSPTWHYFNWSAVWWNSYMAVEQLFSCTDASDKCQRKSPVKRLKVKNITHWVYKNWESCSSQTRHWENTGSLLIRIQNRRASVFTQNEILYEFCSDLLTYLLTKSRKI